MARGRMLSKSIAKSRKFGDLSDDFTRLLYCVLIPFADRDGRIDGEPCLVKAMAMPRRTDVSDKKVGVALKSLVEVGLLSWYSVNGERYIEILNFREHQAGLSYNKEPPSTLPEIPGTLPEIPGTLPEIPGLREDKIREKKRREENPPGKNTLANVNEDFREFYESYPRKEAEDDALKAFKKRYKELPPIDELVLIIENTKKTENWSRDNGKYIPHPATWINNGRWKDELSSKSSGVTPEILEQIKRGEYDG